MVGTLGAARPHRVQSREGLEPYPQVTEPGPAAATFLPGLANPAQRMKLEAIKN